MRPIFIAILLFSTAFACPVAAQMPAPVIKDAPVNPREGISQKARDAETQRRLKEWAKYRPGFYKRYLKPRYQREKMLEKKHAEMAFSKQREAALKAAPRRAPKPPQGIGAVGGGAIGAVGGIGITGGGIGAVGGGIGSVGGNIGAVGGAGMTAPQPQLPAYPEAINP